nr:crotonase/enoyl-CoA hydratase family protein [Nereida sp. MMG025]
MDTIEIEQNARGVATLWLSRPEKRNAMSAQMIAELTQAAQDLNTGGARVVVLRARGDVFCAGGDLGWMRAQMEADRATRAREARNLAMMLKALNELQKPLIGAVEGNSFGGGVGLMSVCDVVIARPSAKFALTETKLGLIPATIGPYVVARLGAGAARQVFMSGRLFDAPEAVRLGLVAQATDDVDGAIDAEITAYLSCAPSAVAAAKSLVHRLDGIADAAIDDSIQALVTQWESPEAQQGIAAFFDKQAAPWVQTPS